MSPLARAEPLLEAARRRTRLSDFGPAPLHAGLEVLLESLGREAALHAAGEALVEADLLRLLENRLAIQAVLDRHPEITARRIERPLVIVGLPRTGSSILHELLAVDPENRTPATWEVKFPCPPPETASAEHDPRIAVMDAELSAMDEAIPAFKKMHPQGARLPQECLNVTTHAFASIFWSVSHDVPTYQTWLDACDHAPIYRLHHDLLRLLHWRRKPERWVLKSSSHLWTLDALLDAYPDACVVQTHRDPLKVLASFTSLVSTLRRLYSGRAEPGRIGPQQAGFLAEGLACAVRFRDRGRLPPEQVYDLQFRDFIADPIERIRDLYRHFGRTLSAEASERMRRYLAAHPGDQYGPHRYRFADTSLDPSVERRRFADYQDRFAIAPEPVT
ncbi:MAG: sulfotransferase [Myxococcota bacterium]